MDRAGTEASASSLFSEYLAIRDQGEALDLDGLLQRAGPGADRVLEHIATLKRVERLGEVLSDEGPREVPELDQLGRFEDLKVLGTSALSRVFLARDARLKREVALKVLHPRAFGGADARERLLAEARSLAQLEHPSIVRVFEADEADGYAYIAMERVRGPNLFTVLEVLRGRNPQNLDEEALAAAVAAADALASMEARCRLVANVARALEYSHAHGIVHRDIKPGNVLIDGSHTPTLIDFGLAHVESEWSSKLVSDSLWGTAAYLSPEQVEEERTGTSPSSDQFSLGVVFYELLTLAHPFLREERRLTFEAIKEASPPPPHQLAPQVPKDVELICGKCLAKDPAARYASIGRFVADLEAYLDSRPISLRPPSAVRYLALWLKRNSRQVAFAAVAVAVLLTVLAIGWLVDGSSERGQLARDVAALQARISLAEEPSEFQDLYEELASQRTRATHLAASPVQGWLLGSPVPMVGDALDTCSQRLAKVLAAEHETVASGPPPTRAPMTRALTLEYARPLALDARICPDAPYNEIDRTRGTVEFPDVPEGFTLRLFKHRAGRWATPAYMSELSVEPRLPDGIYRLKLIDADGRLSSERDFEVLPELRRRQIEFSREIRARGESVRIEGFRLPAFDNRLDLSGSSEHVLAPFSILEDPVSWKEAARVLGLDAIAGQSLGALGDRDGWREATKEPAILSWAKAQEYADRVGARLPTVMELYAALQQLTPNNSIDLEWTATPAITIGHRVGIEYKRLSLPNQLSWIAEFSRSDVIAKTGFRIVVAD